MCKVRDRDLAQDNSGPWSELVIAALVPIAFLVVNLLVASVERIFVALSMLASTHQLIGIAEAFTMGTIFAQVTILAIWAGLSPKAVYLKAFYALLVLIVGAYAVAFFISTFAQNLASVRSEWLSDHKQQGWLALVMVFSSLQLSLFFFRVWGGRFLSLRANAKAGAETTVKRQLSMFELVGLPVLLSFPLIVLTSYFEANAGLIMIAITFVLIIVCLVYAALHLYGFLRERITIGIVVPLITLGPVLLLPVSIYFTGSLNGTYQGIPFFSVVCAVHLGALTVGVPTALFARHIGYRFRQV